MTHLIYGAAIAALTVVAWADIAFADSTEFAHQCAVEAAVEAVVQNAYENTTEEELANPLFLIGMEIGKTVIKEEITEEFDKLPASVLIARFSDVETFIEDLGQDNDEVRRMARTAVKSFTFCMR